MAFSQKWTFSNLHCWLNAIIDGLRQLWARSRRFLATGFECGLRTNSLCNFATNLVSFLASGFGCGVRTNYLCNLVQIWYLFWRMDLGTGYVGILYVIWIKFGSNLATGFGCGVRTNSLCNLVQIWFKFGDWIWVRGTYEFFM